MMAGVNLVHVPYRGEAPALIDMVSGQTQVMFDLMSASIGFRAQWQAARARRYICYTVYCAAGCAGGRGISARL